jgi:hypothetical protein
VRKIALLDKTICLKFCAYYKPGKNEALACRGYTVVEQLMREGRAIGFQGSERTFDAATAEMLSHKMCKTCDFHEHDCDFMLDRTASPCGGFVLLAQLLGSGVITMRDIP